MRSQVPTGAQSQPRSQMSILDMARHSSLGQAPRQINRDRVRAALAFHIGGKLPGIEWTQAIDPLADRFEDLAADNPQLIAVLESDVNAMYALTDADLAGRIARGEPIAQLGDIFDAIAEVSWEVGATELAARFNAEAADAVKGSFDALTLSEATQIITEEGMAPQAVPSFSRYNPAGGIKSATVLTLFDVPGAWSYSPGSRTLAVTVGEQTIGIETRPGFNPENHLDVIAEVVSAQADGRIRGGELIGGQKGGVVERAIGQAHEIGHWLDEHPGVRTYVDAILANIGNQGPSLGDQPTPLQRASDAMRDEEGQMTTESVRLASIMPFPEDAIIASIARVWVSESSGELTSADALTLAGEMVTENRPQLEADYENLTAEELLTQLEESTEGESALGRVVEGGLGSVLESMEAWDRFVHWIGVNIFDFIANGLGMDPTAEGGPDWQPYAGFERLGQLFELQPMGTKASDYFGATGGWADALDLTVAIGFDPLNVIFPGAKGVRALAAKALTDPKYAGIYLRMGQFPHIARQIAQGGRQTVVRTGMELVEDVEAAVARGALSPTEEVAALAEGATATLTREVTEEVALNTKGVLSVLGMSGLDNPEIIDLLKIALDPNGTVGQVNAVWTRALHKDWLGEGPMRAVRHSTVEGMGRMIDSFAAGRLDDETVNEIMQYFVKASVGRTVNLGENRSMDALGDLLVTFFPGDPERAARLYMEAAQAVITAGDSLALAGVTAAQKEVARRAVWEAGGTISAVRGATDTVGISQNLRSIEDTLATLSGRGFDEATEAGIRTELNRMHSVMSRRFDDAKPKMDAARDRIRHGQQQVKKATALEGDMAANASRNVMARQMFGVYEEKAQLINAKFGAEIIPVLKGKVNPLAPDLPVRDWSEVTGLRSVIAGDDPDLALMMGLAVDNVDLARQADAIGWFNRSQKMLLPASPYEVLLFERLGGDRTLLAKVTQQFRRERVKKIGRNMRVMFAFNLLVNPLTAGKITLDETLRFLADTGEVAKFLRATVAGIPGLGRGSEALIHQVQKVARRGGEAVVQPWMLPYKRNVGGWSADDFADYGWVMRPNKNHPGQPYREQVERWVNGSLLNDRRFREYARWINTADTLEDGTKIPPSGWTEFWERGEGVSRPGKADVNPTTITIRDQVITGNQLTATDAFNIVDRVFENWLTLLVDAPAQSLMRSRLLKAAVTPGDVLDVVRDARLLNAVSQVPGLSANTGFGSSIFNIFFGAPSGRRAGVFFEHYYDEAFGILMARHGDRVLTVDKLMDYAKVDRPTAEYWLKQGSDNAIVSQLMRESGVRTEAQLAARAAAYAERRSDDLMYRFTAASLAGRGVESALIMPFARAQADFLSWWSDHLFKPMTTRLSLEQRARLPGLIRTAVEGVESIPINLRAWAKYAHLVAAVNNDQPSVIDQSIDNLTFFPLRFGSEFLIDVTPSSVEAGAVTGRLTPQPGPWPAWMFDLMVDQGVIGPEAEANMEALFPALGYTDFDSSDPVGDIFDRLLPNSRRSIRDLTVGMMRGGYALFGEDIHTNEGWMGQIANLIADGKVPAATGDFQAALASEFIGENIWNVVPGSDEWNDAIREVAISGAAEANRSEWSQDMRDRTFPLASYDKEYRAMAAFASMFDEERFSVMVNAGLFTAADMFEVDGQPRIQAAWEKYQRGEADDSELAWLDDRLTTAYFEAGRLEVLPGFSYMDYLHLTAPELTVNLIQKSEDSGIPVRGGERGVGSQRMTHAEFKQTYINALTGRLQNVPPGQEGSDIRAAAFDYGWVVSRPVEEWALDAGQAVYKSGQRALRGVWQAVSHRTWQQGTTKAIEDRSFTLGRKEAMILQAAGMDVAAGTSFTYGEFHRLLDDFDERFAIAQPVLLDTLARGAVHGQLALHNDEFGLGLLEDLGEADLAFDKLGIESVEDWPEASKAAVRVKFNEAITRGYTTLADYNQEIAPIFGALDYEPPVPPPVADLERGIRISGDEMDDLAVIDGDTVTIMLEDGPMRIRLIGLNTPEITQPGYAEARGMLEEVIAGASEVVFGVYQPEVFGLTQLTAPGERRLLAFLYVDGVPIYDPSVFTSENPRGAGVGGAVVDLPAILEAGRQ